MVKLTLNSSPVYGQKETRLEAFLADSEESWDVHSPTRRGHMSCMICTRLWESGSFRRPPSVMTSFATSQLACGARRYTFIRAFWMAGSTQSTATRIAETSSGQSDRYLREFLVSPTMASSASGESHEASTSTPPTS